MSGEDASSQVLLASDGRQMNPTDHIGAYAITVCSYILMVYTAFLGC